MTFEGLRLDYVSYFYLPINLFGFFFSFFKICCDCLETQ